MNSLKRIALAVAVVLSPGLPGGVETAAAQGFMQRVAADVMIEQAFTEALQRPPDDSERRRYRVRIFEDHWNQRDIERDLRDRRDYRSYNSYRDRSNPTRSEGDVDRMIERAYDDILGRRPDREGMRTYRQRVIDEGWTERQLREVLRKSPESQSRSSEAVDQIIRRAYLEVLGRAPDSAGLYEYRNQMMHHGWEEHDLIQALRNSPEYRQRNTISEADARAIVRRAYLSVLNREPDPGSAGFVQSVIRDHWTERDVARELRNSEEYRKR